METTRVVSQWDAARGVLRTELRGLVTPGDVERWRIGLAAAEESIPAGRHFKVLLDLRGLEATDIEAHKLMRAVVPGLLARHGLRPAVLDLFPGTPEPPLETRGDARCLACANVHHDAGKMAEYEAQIATGDQRFFTDIGEAEAWLERAGSAARMYGDFSGWWPLLSAPEEYAEEAGFYTRVIEETAGGPVREVLELGSGGGNNASHMKARFQLTLVDPAAGMLDVSRRRNPDCEHVLGDMRTVRLGRTFDAVFVHDAIAYMTSEADLRRAIETAAVHCAPGGAVLLCPDYTRERFKPTTDCGGHDGPDRALRYLEWVWDPNPDDSLYVADYVYTMRLPDGSVHVAHDRHVEGLFDAATWLQVMDDCGFDAREIPFEHSELEPGAHSVFAGRKR